VDNFLRIQTFYSEPSIRSFAEMVKIYQQSDVLFDKVYKLVEEDLIRTKLITGKKILLKPNWVLHDRKPDDAWCMRTHTSVLIALLEVILKENPKQVVIGDAPVQGCDWDRMLSAEFVSDVTRLSKKYSIPVLIKDFRRVTFNPDKNNPVKERNPLSSYLIFDLKSDSYLDPISSESESIFRVTNYDPDRLAESHRKGMHKYCITKEVFDADLVISLPKIKTHQKTGITAALKNIVGINGDKDYLPHHRIGGAGFGGDCYPGRNYLRLWAEKALDRANRKQGKSIYWFWEKLSAVLWKLSMPKKVHHIAAAWYGNDTTWRMVMDLNKIVQYGTAAGEISEFKQRKLFSLGDGIIGGQGDGPLRPVPLPMGILTFTDNSGLHDLGIGKLMRFNKEKIPLLKTAAEQIKSAEINIFVNGISSTLNDLTGHSIETLSPPGWVDYLRENG
jgi:uncharacterized protein (DUF362 family)